MKKRWYWLALAGLLGLAVIAWQLKLPALAYYWLSMQQHADDWQERGIWLPLYRVAVEGRPIDGITENASGLTFNKTTGTLFSVLNRPPELIELSTEGRLLRRISLKGAGDPEGITHVRDDVFILSDEHQQQLYRIRIGPETKEVDVRDVPRLGLAIDYKTNLGFEGVSWDAAHQRLYITKEKSPLRIIVINGLPELLEGRKFDLQISEWKSSQAKTLFMTDLSSLTLHEPTGNMLLMSHESALIVEYAMDGTPISLLPMWRGFHGLKRNVPQAEGVAVGPDGTIYVLSEPNLFYRFERTQPPAWATVPATATPGSGPNVSQ